MKFYSIIIVTRGPQWMNLMTSQQTLTLFVLNLSLPVVRVATLLSELLYCRPSALTQTLYTVPHISPETMHPVSASVPTQEVLCPFWLSK